MDVVKFYTWRDLNQESALKERYDHIQYDFLTMLQQFHDIHENWVKNPGPGWSLSERGWWAYWMLRETARQMDDE